MSEINTYKVVAATVHYVAGIRVPSDRKMRMTAEEARYDVAAGILELDEQEEPARTKAVKSLPVSASGEG